MHDLISEEEKKESVLRQQQQAALRDRAVASASYAQQHMMGLVK